MSVGGNILIGGGQAFNIFEIINPYATKITNTVDIKFFDADNVIVSPSLSDFVVLTSPIRLLSLEYNFRKLQFNNLVAGEYGFRDIDFYECDITSFLLKGKLIKGSIDALPLFYDLNKSNNLIDFGQGIIIDDFEFPVLVKCGMSSDPPLNNSIIVFEMFMIIKYNYNFDINLI